MDTSLVVFDAAGHEWGEHDVAVCGGSGPMFQSIVTTSKGGGRRRNVPVSTSANSELPRKATTISCRASSRATSPCVCVRALENYCSSRQRLSAEQREGGGSMGITYGFDEGVSERTWTYGLVYGR